MTPQNCADLCSATDTHSSGLRPTGDHDGHNWFPVPTPSVLSEVPTGFLTLQFSQLWAPVQTFQHPLFFSLAEPLWGLPEMNLLKAVLRRADSKDGEQTLGTEWGCREQVERGKQARLEGDT